MRLRGLPIESFVMRPQPQLTEEEKEQLREGMRRASLLAGDRA